MRRERLKPAGYHWSEKEHVRQPDGSPSCRWCKGPVPKGRRSFCSDACVDQWTLRTQPARLRDLVFARDRGVCAACGADTLARDPARIRVQIVYAEMIERRTRRGSDWRGIWHGTDPAEVVILGPDGRPYPAAHWHAMLAEAHRWRAENRVGLYAAVWEVDHVTPLADGGDPVALSNLMTLCSPCHRAKTSRENRGRAGRRRAESSGGTP